VNILVTRSAKSKALEQRGTLLSHSPHRAYMKNMLVWQVDANTQSRKRQLSAEPDSEVEQIQLKKAKTGMALTVSTW